MQWRTQGGNGGPDSPFFKKDGPRDSHKKCDNICAGACQSFIEGFWVSNECLNSAGRGILSQSRIVEYISSKIFLGALPPHPINYFNISSYLSLSMPLAIGILICCYC